MLKLQPTEPQWLEVMPDVRIKFAPINIKAVRAARAAVAQALGVDPEDVEAAGDALTSELLRRGILEWAGVGDADGNPIPVTPEAVEAFIADPKAFEAADLAYVWPWAQRDIEKNGSGASPNGTSAEGTPAPDTARSAARPKRKGGAARTRKADRRGAPTSNTSPQPTKVKPSGQ